jgi:crossover junction endodeoxyribonuclease RuvC
MKIIAIDPGYERLGVAIIEKVAGQKEVLLFSDCLQTDKKFDHSERLFQIKTGLDEIIKKHKPEFLAIEKLFFSKNQKTAMLVAEARGAILVTGKSHGLEIHEFTPNAIKVAVTGYGKSDKKTIINFLPKIIEIKKTIKHDDEFDAIATGITFFATYHPNF